MRKPAKRSARTPTPRKHSRKPAPIALTAAERHAALEQAFSAIEAQLSPSAIISLQTSGLTLRAIPLGTNAQASWLLRTSGLSTRVGCELSFRVRRGTESAPPTWATELLAKLATQELRFDDGQVVRVEGLFGADTELDSVALVLDPSLQLVRTAHDAVPVLLAVGITKDEARLVREWSPRALIEIYAQLDASLCTLPERPSLLASPRARSAIEQRVSREGSSMGQLSARVSATSAGRERLSWKLDAESADAVVSLLKGRIGHQRAFVVKSASHEVELAPGDRPAFALEGHRAHLKVTQPFARAMRATLRPTPGTYVFTDLPGLTIEVVA